MNVEGKETLKMSLLKMCNIRTVNVMIVVRFVIRQRRAKDWCYNYNIPSEDACGRCLIIILTVKF